MRALIIEHDPFSPPGPVADRLAHHGFEVTELIVVSPEAFPDAAVECAFPDPADWDLIVPMGAPWSVDDREKIGAWVGDELAMLGKAHSLGVPTLGICFGGQALAAALGGGVERAPRAEIGWTTIESDDPALVSPGPWFQFHYDRWTLPPGATEIARNEVGSQAYVLDRTMAVQFHPELTVAELELWLANGGVEELAAQNLDPAPILAETAAKEPAAVLRAHTLIDAFLTQVARLP